MTKIVQSLYVQQDLNVAEIKRNPWSIRSSRTGILEESIKGKGILQPIMVRQKKSGRFKYEVVFGDGRLETAIKLKAKTIPAIIRECDNQEALLLNVDENSARDNFTFPEKSKAYWLLNKERKMSYRDIA